MGGNPSESDLIIRNCSMAQEGTKGPMSLDALHGLEMEADDDWWSIEDSYNGAMEKELRDMWNADNTVIDVPSVSPMPVTYASRCSKNGKAKKHVAFSSIQVRSYEVILGDHPCCVNGCPITISWAHFNESVLPLDDYEAERPQRRCRDELRTTRDKRRAMLVDYTDGDVRRVQRRLQRERPCRSKALASFFSPAMQPQLVRTPSCE